MTVKFLKAFIALWCVASWPADAETIKPAMAKLDVCGRYDVAHVNGVGTTSQQAQENLVALMGAYGNAYYGHVILYHVAYNTTAGLYADVIDAYKQLVAEYPTMTWVDWMRAIMAGEYPQTLPPGFSGALLARLQALLGLRKPASSYDVDLITMTGQIRARGSLNRRFLMVAHSQGTLYANLLYDRLVAGSGTPVYKIPAESIGIVDVAAMVPTIRDNGAYATSTRDLVVGATRLALPMLALG